MSWVLQVQLRCRPSGAVTLSFLLLSLAAAGTLSADRTPADCEPRHCGDGLEISYPFWISGVQNAYCGHPGYNVSCNVVVQGAAHIDDGVETYVVREIFYDNMSLIVADQSTAARSTAPCPLHPRHNLSFSHALYNVSSVNRELLFYLNCTAETAPGLSRIEGCADDDRGTKFSLVADRQSPAAAWNVSPPPCESVVVSPFLQGDGAVTAVDSRSFGSLLSHGFLLEWRAPNCNSCRSSGGRCGYSKTDPYFMCICSGRVHRISCDGPTTATTTARSGINKLRKIVIVVVAGVTGFLLTGILICLLAYKRKRMSSRTELSFHTTSSPKDLCFNFPNTISPGNVDVSDVPLLDLKNVKAATSNFSAENKLGEGGFGPVYKGKLLGGGEIAVKRLSKLSKQGHQEFSNEVRLIAKLQHKNLVRLLGSCAHKDEKLLIYEYMPNKSLDKFIFDRRRAAELSWPKRFGIIQGIANGLLYLHQYSRMRIIHRDLKTSNILLDGEMNPKISDFGLARIFGVDQMEANTGKIVGTFGYISPEYASQGLFSEKSDVFSFGVILLEIITGKRSTSFYPHKNSQTLLGYVWQMWEEGRAVELLDPSTGSSPTHAGEVLKCTQLGLLCVQQDAAERPTMSYVVSSLSSETCVLPNPGQPAFTIGRDPNPIRYDGASRASVNGLTMSSAGGR